MYKKQTNGLNMLSVSSTVDCIWNNRKVFSFLVSTWPHQLCSLWIVHVLNFLHSFFFLKLFSMPKENATTTATTRVVCALCLRHLPAIAFCCLAARSLSLTQFLLSLLEQKAIYWQSKQPLVCDTYTHTHTWTCKKESAMSSANTINI